MAAGHRENSLLGLRNMLIFPISSTIFNSSVFRAHSQTPREPMTISLGEKRGENLLQRDRDISKRVEIMEMILSVIVLLGLAGTFLSIFLLRSRAIFEIMKFLFGGGMLSRGFRRQQVRQYAARRLRFFNPSRLFLGRGLGKFSPILYPGCSGWDDPAWQRPFSPSWIQSSRSAHECPVLSSTVSAKGFHGSVPFP